MTAGHNTLRGSGPGQKHAFDDAVALQRIPVILKHSLRERNSWRIRLGLVVG